MDEREVRVFGYCENCSDEVTDENNVYDGINEYFVNDDGEIFCCIDCVCEHYNLTRIEL